VGQGYTLVDNEMRVIILKAGGETNVLSRKSRAKLGRKAKYRLVKLIVERTAPILRKTGNLKISQD